MLIPPLLRLKALQPPIQRLVEEPPARLPQRNRSPEIKAMLRILKDIAKDLVFVLFLAALGRIGERAGMRGERLGG